MAYDTVRTKMGDLGVQREAVPPPRKDDFKGMAKRVEDVLDKIVSIPKIEMDPLPQLKEVGTEETQVLLFSDSQVGQRTPEYNSEVFRAEMKVLQKGVQKLCLIHRRACPVKNLAVFFLGDIIENERIGYQVSLDELEKVVLEQIFDVSTPAISEFLVNCLQLYERIDCYCVMGNHGKLGKFAANTTNWDTIVYKILELRLREFDRIKWHIEAQHFYQIAEVMGHKFLLLHGDQVPSYLGLPHYGLERRIIRLKVNLPQTFEAACLGHFHSPNIFTYGGILTIVNSTFMVGSDYPLQKLGLADQPSQITFFVHPKRTTTAFYFVSLKDEGKIQKQE